jgi:type II secretory pathway pseudopilin PulG
LDDNLTMPRRKAFTLLELVVSLASSIMLVAGLAGSLYISNQALIGSSSARQTLAASTVLRELMANVSQAKSITERTATAITFTVPDRDEDNIRETIRYAWSGVAGEPLTYQYNGGAIANIATDVRAFNLSALTRELQPPSPQVAQGVTFHGPATEMPMSVASIQMDIPLPTGTIADDLLIACVATDGGTALSNPAGWNRVDIGSNSWNNGSKTGAAVTFGIWWKRASGSEPSSHRFTWDVSKKAYGWMMRFSGHDINNPIHAFYPARGGAINSTPPSPSVTTTVPNAMILRLGGFDDPDINVGNPGAGVGNPITMNRSGTGLSQCSGGAGWQVQSSAGASGLSNFTLTGSEEYVTVTIAIAPETAE